MENMKKQTRNDIEDFYMYIDSTVSNERCGVKWSKIMEDSRL